MLLTPTQEREMDVIQPDIAVFLPDGAKHNFERALMSSHPLITFVFSALCVVVVVIVVFPPLCHKSDSENGAWLSRKYLVAANILVSRNKATLDDERCVFAMYGHPPGFP